MKPIRIALSGSGFKFPAHCGALLAIEEAGYRAVEIAGTSGGSIVAALYAAGMPVDQMRDLTLSRDWSDMLSWTPLSLLTQMGFCSGKNLLSWISGQTSGHRFGDLAMDLSIVASDIENFAPFVFSRDGTPDVEISLAARASASIPFVYTPVRYEDRWLMDGGICDNIPVNRLKSDSVPKIGVQLVSKTAPLKPGFHTILDVAPRVIELMMASNENTHVELAKTCGANIVFVETGYASGLDRNMSVDLRKRLLMDGYQATKAAMANLTAPALAGVALN